MKHWPSVLIIVLTLTAALGAQQIININPAPAAPGVDGPPAPEVVIRDAPIKVIEIRPGLGVHENAPVLVQISSIRSVRPFAATVTVEQPDGTTVEEQRYYTQVVYHDGQTLYDQRQYHELVPLLQDLGWGQGVAVEPYVFPGWAN